jgi:hypothetical protein
MAGSVWVRRFGVRATHAGMLVVSPLIAVLIIGQGGAGQAGLGWVVLIALIACGWVNAFYGWFGESPGALLDTRLEGVLLGAALGIGASWLILPVRTGDVLRRRSADAVAALGDVLGADRSDPAALRRGQVAFERSVGRLAAIGYPLRAQRLLLARWRAASGRGGDAIDAIERSAEPVRLFVQAAAREDRDGDAFAAVRGNVTAIRRAIGRRPGAPYRPAVFGADTGDVTSALRQIDGALGALSAAFAGS